LWSFSDLFVNQGVQFVLQVILARLLLPSDFGIIGMITIFVAVSNVFIDSGFTQALIREKEVTQSDYSTVFFFNLLMSAGLYIILFFVSRLISEFFREPQLVAIIKVLSITFIINAFGLIPKTILIKRLDFKTQTKINVLSSVLSGILSILFAISGFGVWSLVAKSLSMQLFQTVFLSLSTRWIPATMFSFSSFRRLFQFGSRLLVAGLINTIYDNVFFVIIGKLFSANDLGYFTQAKKLSDLSSHSITQSLQRVMYPAFSYIKEDNAKLKEVFRKSIKLTSFVSFLLLALLIVSASDIFTLTVGKNWYPSIPYFQVLCLAGLLYPLHALNLNLLQVKGRSDIYLKLEITKKILFIMILVICLQFVGGVISLVWATVLNSFLALFLNMIFTKRLIQYSMKEQLCDILPSLAIASLAAIMTYIPSFFFHLHPLLMIAIQFTIGFTVYILLAKLFNLTELTTIKNLIVSFAIRECE